MQSLVKSSIKIHFHTDNLKDIENKTRDISDKSYLENYEFKLTSNDDIDYAITLFKQVYDEKSSDLMKDYKICPACEAQNNIAEEYCLTCGQKLVESEDKEEINEEKLPIPKDKIILLDLNYTLISNSWAIRYEKYPQKITKREYEHELVDLIKDHYVILITASPDYTYSNSLKHIEENTDLK